MKILVKFSIVIVALVSLAFTLKPRKVRIFLVGDSTMSEKKAAAAPEMGWGMIFTKFADTSNTIVKNVAQNGRSSRTFIEEGRWQAVLDSLEKGDIVLIQFGHNDEIRTKPQSTTKAVFQQNLKRYIRDVKAKKAIPVLITPAARRSFSADGKLDDTHKVYSALVRKVAKRHKVNMIDLDKKSQDLLISLGVENSKWLFNHLRPGQHPNFPEGKEDDTHFSELGARKMAEIVYQELSVQNPGNINDHFFKPKSKR